MKKDTAQTPLEQRKKENHERVMNFGRFFNKKKDRQQKQAKPS